MSLLLNSNVSAQAITCHRNALPLPTWLPQSELEGIHSLIPATRDYLSFIVSLGNLHRGVFSLLSPSQLRLSGENKQMEELAGLGSVPELAVQAIFLLWPQFTQLENGVVRMYHSCPSLRHPCHLSDFRCCLMSAILYLLVFLIFFFKLVQFKIIIKGNVI